MARKRGPGLEAAVRNAPVLLILWAAGGALVVAYGRHPGLTAWADQVADAKAAAGLIGAFCAGAVAGGVLPESAKAIAGRIRRLDGAWLRLSGFTALVYGGVSVLVDLFYLLLARTVGEGRDIATVGIKTAIDMLVFTPLLSIPFAAGMFAWRGMGFRLSAIPGLFTWRAWKRYTWPILPMCWTFWTPALCMVYSLPYKLQFSFAVLLEAAWSVLFVFMATQGDAPVSHGDQG
jgi:hypothetical protein